MFLVHTYRSVTSSDVFRYFNPELEISKFSKTTVQGNVPFEVGRAIIRIPITAPIITDSLNISFDFKNPCVNPAHPIAGRMTNALNRKGRTNRALKQDEIDEPLRQPGETIVTAVDLRKDGIVSDETTFTDTSITDGRAVRGEGAPYGFNSYGVTVQFGTVPNVQTSIPNYNQTCHLSDSSVDKQNTGVVIGGTDTNSIQTFDLLIHAANQGGDVQTDSTSVYNRRRPTLAQVVEYLEADNSATGAFNGTTGNSVAGIYERVKNLANLVYRDDFCSGF